RALIYATLAGLVAAVVAVRWIFLTDPPSGKERAAAALRQARWLHWWSAKRVTHPCGLTAVLLPPGEALLGHPQEDQPGRPTPPGRKPGVVFDAQAPFALTELVYLGTHEVTQEQYERVMGVNPSLNKGPGLPVERVTWEDALR